MKKDVAKKILNLVILILIFIFLYLIYISAFHMPSDPEEIGALQMKGGTVIFVILVLAFIRTRLK
ncbi:hypothetical protein E2R60_15815 [Paenibacillus dendritiformis]|uniref:hypothetical protein n=1 Tax=Paenibacillus dendritiformis TaxID=130049 RepID=UPI001059600A|nr:hypothetical protein [Paenibacillus dendritiformis]TDL52692.1 hypothetical protein E2R60_15815 [Paenibacillus dendritiformis]